MAFGTEELKIVISADDKASRKIARLSSDVGGLGKITGFAKAGALALGAGLAAITFAAVKLSKSVLEASGDLEQNRIAFETMLGSADLAGAKLKEITEFAIKTPFTLPEVQKGAKQLLAFGIETDKLLPTLKSLGDVSAGLGVPMERLILNFGQVAAQGKLTGRELRDFAIAGVPLLEELADMLGKSKVEIQDMVSAGEIGFPIVEEAFTRMTSEGGRFENLMEKQSKTLQGTISNLKDSFVKLLWAVGGLTDEGEIVKGGFFDKVKDAATELQEWMGENTAAFSALGAVIGTVLGTVAGAVSNVAKKITEWTKANAPLIETLLIGIQTYLQGGSATDVMTEAMERQRMKAEEHKNKIAELTDQYVDEKNVIDEARESLEERIATGELSQEEIDKENEKLGELETQHDETKKAIDDEGTALNTLIGWQEKLEKFIRGELIPTLENLRRTYEEDIEPKINAVGDASKYFFDRITEVNEAIEKQTKPLDDLNKKLDELRGESGDASSGIDDLKSALDVLTAWIGFNIFIFRTLIGVIDLIGSAASWSSNQVNKLANALDRVKIFGGGGGGTFQVGGTVPETGMFQLHKGEKVVSTAEQRGSIGSQTININFGGMTITNEADEDRLVKKIEEALGRKDELAQTGINL